jgi:histidine triad (HIT) family protein
MSDCIFCKIVNRQLPAEIIYQDDKAIVFKDIHPKAPIHFLIVPKKHIDSINTLLPEDKELMGELFLVAQKIAREKEISGYKLVINVGPGGGQLVEHLHIHFLSGKITELP